MDREDEGKFFLIHVEDRGHGIMDEIRDHMYEPFVSSKHTVGVGMGLTIARHAVRNLGGDVGVENREGGGAIATLRHPIQRKQR